jgi:hypothetical protein
MSSWEYKEVMSSKELTVSPWASRSAGLTRLDEDLRVQHHHLRYLFQRRCQSQRKLRVDHPALERFSSALKRIEMMWGLYSACVRMKFVLTIIRILVLPRSLQVTILHQYFLWQKFALRWNVPQFNEIESSSFKGEYAKHWDCQRCRWWTAWRCSDM